MNRAQPDSKSNFETLRSREDNAIVMSASERSLAMNGECRIKRRRVGEQVDDSVDSPGINRATLIAWDGPRVIVLGSDGNTSRSTIEPFLEIPCPPSARPITNNLLWSYDYDRGPSSSCDHMQANDHMLNSVAILAQDS